MTQDEYIKELKELFNLAVTQEQLSEALELLDRIRIEESVSGEKSK